MPSIAFGQARSATSARIISVPGVVDGTGSAEIGRIGAALLMGSTEIYTTDPALAARARAVVDRLLAARAGI